MPRRVAVRGSPNAAASGDAARARGIGRGSLASTIRARCVVGVALPTARALEARARTLLRNLRGSRVLSLARSRRARAAQRTMSAVVAAADQSTVDDEILSLQKKAEDMKEAAGRSVQFSGLECEGVLSSLYGCLPLASDANGIDWSELEEFLEERAHLQPKDWPSTTVSATLLKDIVGTPNNSEIFRKMFGFYFEPNF